MKYNPKINEDVAKFPGFTGLHPYAPVAFSQGSLQLMYELRQYLSEIFGMADFTLQPAAGAHGELTGIMIFKKYFEKTGEKRTKILIPDAAHGTNPASGALCGYRTLTVRSNADGGVDIDHLASLMSDDTAGLMLTNPNTLGLFERNRRSGLRRHPAQSSQDLLHPPRLRRSGKRPRRRRGKARLFPARPPHRKEQRTGKSRR